MQKTKSIYLIIGLILICFSSIYIFTRDAFFNAFVLQNKGQIGDTIGGITAPFINIFGAILVFVSFRAQNEANILQAEQNTFTFLHALFLDLKKDYENLTFNI